MKGGAPVNRISPPPGPRIAHHACDEMKVGLQQPEQPAGIFGLVISGNRDAAYLKGAARSKVLELRARRASRQAHENDATTRARHFAGKDYAILAYCAEFRRQPINHVEQAGGVGRERRHVASIRPLHSDRK
jgi:hypothetical protein